MKILITFLIFCHAHQVFTKNETLNVGDFIKSKCDVGPNANFPGEITGETVKFECNSRCHPKNAKCKRKGLLQQKD